MRTLLSLMLFTVSALSGIAIAQSNPPLLLRYPTVSKTQIVFNYAGDLWIVSRDGGDAHRLTSGVGSESFPHFSPDGSLIAFTEGAANIGKTFDELSEFIRGAVLVGHFAQIDLKILRKEMIQTGHTL